MAYNWRGYRSTRDLQHEADGEVIAGYLNGRKFTPEDEAALVKIVQGFATRVRQHNTRMVAANERKLFADTKANRVRYSHDSGNARVTLFDTAREVEVSLAPWPASFIETKTAGELQDRARRHAAAIGLELEDHSPRPELEEVA